MSMIYIANFFVLAFPFIKQFSIVFFASSSPQFLPPYIQTFKHCTLFYIFAGVVYFSKVDITTSPRSGLLGSLIISCRRSYMPESLILGAFDLSFWAIV